VRDFTTTIFEELCISFKEAGYEFITFADYCVKQWPEKLLILRHDVDKDPLSALRIAFIENSLGIKASYYFRIVKTSFDEEVIEGIAGMKHEIGYHYEDLATVDGNMRYAIKSFSKNLARLRRLYPVRTICMHGSPLSNYDNRLLWKEYDYREFGIIGDPYFDVDFGSVMYLTDTGRRWNGEEVTVRDRVDSKYKHSFKSTFDILRALTDNALPQQLMINMHPQRWNNDIIIWFRELIWQNVKNVAKKYLLVRS
jgi:hypothetical protein